MKTTLAGVQELAALSGLDKRTVSAYVARKQMPKPDAHLASGPVWDTTRKDVQEWIRQRKGRK